MQLELCICLSMQCSARPQHCHATCNLPCHATFDESHLCRAERLMQSTALNSSLPAMLSLLPQKVLLPAGCRPTGGATRDCSTAASQMGSCAGDPAAPQGLAASAHQLRQAAACRVQAPGTQQQSCLACSISSGRSSWCSHYQWLCIGCRCVAVASGEQMVSLGWHLFLTFYYLFPRSTQSTRALFCHR